MEVAINKIAATLPAPPGGGDYPLCIVFSSPADMRGVVPDELISNVDLFIRVGYQNVFTPPTHVVDAAQADVDRVLLTQYGITPEFINNVVMRRFHQGQDIDPVASERAPPDLQTTSVFRAIAPGEGTPVPYTITRGPRGGLGPTTAHARDTLFVVIDPYWSSPVAVDSPFGGGSKRSNSWDITHGADQYQWLKATLERSTAKHKFVFAHHVMGTGRGGVELAGLWEWGGRNANGTYAFTTQRPGWSAPIHRLLADNRVSVFFQGHDHIWARQELDGVTYQTLPEPADPFYAFHNETAYLSGERLPNSGYARVTVSPDAVKVEYVRTWLPADETDQRRSGTVASSYPLPARSTGSGAAGPASGGAVAQARSRR